MRIVIIGAVAGGASAAARARRLSEDAEIILIERGPTPSFANCGLPYYIGGVIENRNSLLVAPAERLVNRYRLDVRTNSEALRIDREKKIVRVRNLQSGAEYDQPYDKLILSPGAAPIRPPIPGVELDGVCTLRDLRDADRLHAAAATARTAVIVGGGFIGIEMAENLVHRGVHATVVELSNQILPPWDAEMVAPFAEHLRTHGVRLVLGDSAESIAPARDGRAEGRDGDAARLSVRLKSGAQCPADLVVLSVGVRPESKLAVESGLAVGQRGGIQVNATMQTSDPDVYAVGDAVETQSALDGAPTQIPLAGPANRQGRIAADHIFGLPARFRGVQGTAIVGAFGMTAAMTGYSEKVLAARNIPFRKIYIHPANHAGYYPGAQAMSLKLLFAPSDGKLLGAQAVGRSGVDKRIDVLAVALQAGMTVYDLEEVELAYAPQFGAAKDPINMAGFVAANSLRDGVAIVHAAELLPSPGELVLDVRTPEEFAAGHIASAVSIPLDELRGRLDELPKDRPIAAYCKVGQRGYLATRLLAARGFDVRNLSGGFTTYLAEAAARG